MQKILPEMEKMAGGTLELDVRWFDPLRQQVLLNSKNKAVYWGGLEVNGKIKTHEPLFPRIEL